MLNFGPKWFINQCNKTCSTSKLAYKVCSIVGKFDHFMSQLISSQSKLKLLSGCQILGEDFQSLYVTIYSVHIKNEMAD